MGRTAVVEAMAAGAEPPLADGLIRLSVLTQSAFARVAERHMVKEAQDRARQVHPRILTCARPMHVVVPFRMNATLSEVGQLLIWKVSVPR